uniref:SAM domain-containing protein n=1 Tax=Amphimedon queenslandica TaxID=400682 RepID=A0A1X7U6W2_AMPQE
MDSSSTPEEVASFLEEQICIPSTFTQAFIDYCIDGIEFYNLTLDDLEKLMKPILICEKIYRHIEKHSEKASSNTCTTVHGVTANNCCDTETFP